MKAPQDELVLSIYPTPRGFAYTLFEAPLSPVDWGSRELTGKDKREDARRNREALQGDPAGHPRGGRWRQRQLAAIATRPAPLRTDRCNGGSREHRLGAVFAQGNPRNLSSSIDHTPRNRAGDSDLHSRIRRSSATAPQTLEERRSATVALRCGIARTYPLRTRNGSRASVANITRSPSDINHLGDTYD